VYNEEECVAACCEWLFVFALCERRCLLRYERAPCFLLCAAILRKRCDAGLASLWPPCGTLSLLQRPELLFAPQEKRRSTLRSPARPRGPIILEYRVHAMRRGQSSGKITHPTVSPPARPAAHYSGKAAPDLVVGPAHSKCAASAECYKPLSLQHQQAKTLKIPL
jgi:hypothetical protein